MKLQITARLQNFVKAKGEFDITPLALGAKF